MYPNNLARWLSPDPVAGSVLNPQSLNRYAYVLNNPVNGIDPLGLQGGQGYNSPNESCGPFGNAAWCNMSGPMGAPYNVAWAAANQLSFFFPADSPLNQAYSQYAADMNSVVVSGYYFLTGEEFKYRFTSWDAYADWFTWYVALPENQLDYLDKLNAQLANVIEGLRKQGATDKKIRDFINENSRRFSEITVVGGNVHFIDTGFQFGCPQNRCDNGLDFSHGGSFHRDTANPYNFPWGTLVHFVVDVLGGQFVSVIPRH